MSSYVTRRLLRSTLPGSKDAEEKPQDAERKPTASCGSRTRDDRRKKARRDAAKAREAGSEPEAPPVGEERADGGASALHGFELMVDVNYAKELWAQARVLDLDADKQEVFVHYMGWNARYDAWVGPKLVAPHGSRTSTFDVAWRCGHLQLTDTMSWLFNRVRDQEEDELGREAIAVRAGRGVDAQEGGGIEQAQVASA